MTDAQLLTLKDVIVNDRRGYGFAPMVTAGQTSALADALNLPRDGTTGRAPTTPTAALTQGGAAGVAGGVITVRRTTIMASEIRPIIDVRDLQAPTTGNNAQAAAWLQAVLTDRAPIVLLEADGTTKTVTRNNLDLLVLNTNGTQTRLNNVAKKVGASVAEELFGEGTVLTDANVAAALSR
jgi:hypothetical protein